MATITMPKIESPTIPTNNKPVIELAKPESKPESKPELVTTESAIYDELENGMDATIERAEEVKDAAKDINRLLNGAGVGYPELFKNVLYDDLSRILQEVIFHLEETDEDEEVGDIYGYLLEAESEDNEDDVTTTLQLELKQKITEYNLLLVDAPMSTLQCKVDVLHEKAVVLLESLSNLIFTMEDVKLPYVLEFEKEYNYHQHTDFCDRLTERIMLVFEDAFESIFRVIEEVDVPDGTKLNFCFSYS